MTNLSGQEIEVEAGKRGKTKPGGENGGCRELSFHSR